MSDLNYNITISATAEVRALRELEDSLQTQIVQARILGREYGELEGQLARARDRLDEFNIGVKPVSAVPGGGNGIPQPAEPDAPPVRPGPEAGAAVVLPPGPAPLTGGLQELGEAFAEYHAANLAALAELRASLTARTAELRQYTDRRINDLANP